MKVLEADRIQINPAFLAEVRRVLAAAYGPRLDRIILFGSYARGEARSASDIDLLIVLTDHPIDISVEIAHLNDLLYPLGLAYDSLISVVPVSTTDFDQNSWHPLYRNIKQEGILI